jgi:hypothetical protein
MGSCVALPALTLAAYFVCLWLAPDFSRVFLHGEDAAIEMGTAALFLATSCGAIGLVARTRGAVPAIYRTFYVLIALAGVFVGLEEISYGQKLFHWNSPEWFTQHNSKAETNLHNMLGSKPSDHMRALASVGCPLLCVALPLATLARRGLYRPGHWAYYLLPRMELAMLAMVTLALTVLNKVPSVKGMAMWTGHLGELKELYWSAAALGYVLILWRRLTATPGRVARGSESHADRESAHAKAA